MEGFRGFFLSMKNRLTGRPANAKVIGLPRRYESNITQPPPRSQGATVLDLGSPVAGTPDAVDDAIGRHPAAGRDDDGVDDQGGERTNVKPFPTKTVREWQTADPGSILLPDEHDPVEPIPLRKPDEPDK